jgi:LPXTG-motif cell wall-anchored protein
VYDKALVSGGAGTLAMLPVTGLNVLWLVIAGFTLLMAGGALLRIAPKRHS